MKLFNECENKQNKNRKVGVETNHVDVVFPNPNPSIRFLNEFKFVSSTRIFHSFLITSHAFFCY
jgi:hypothetical protein